MTAQSTTTIDLIWGDWQDGGSNGLGNYWYSETQHAEDCSGDDKCGCEIQTVSAFEDVQDGEPHQWYAWLGDYSRHDYAQHSPLMASRDEAVDAIPE